MKWPGYSDVEMIDAEEAHILYPTALSSMARRLLTRVTNSHFHFAVDANNVLWCLTAANSKTEQGLKMIGSAQYWDEAGHTWRSADYFTPEWVPDNNFPGG